MPDGLRIDDLLDAVAERVAEQVRVRFEHEGAAALKPELGAGAG